MVEVDCSICGAYIIIILIIMETVKCKKCGYEWETSSTMVMVSCPSCGNKVKIREIKE